MAIQAIHGTWLKMGANPTWSAGRRPLRAVLYMLRSPSSSFHQQLTVFTRPRQLTHRSIMSGPKIPTNEKGEFIRPESGFRNFVTVDGSSGFKAESGRYHLYVSLACPWACRTLMGRALKGLEDAISVTIVDINLTDGWKFTDKEPRCTLDTVNHKDTLREVYQIAEPGYSGRVTVPVLWDKQLNTMVSNESSEILRMMATGVFDSFCRTPEQAALDLYPQNLRQQIEELNGWILPNVNNGVYKCGFGTKQEGYDTAVKDLFGALEKLESILSTKRYLCGSQFTEADVRLVTTLFRFDSVYHGLFKCNKKCLRDYPNLWGYTRDIYSIAGVADTVDLYHITHHYWGSLLSINPHGIVPVGPDIDFSEPHDRARLG